MNKITTFLAAAALVLAVVPAAVRADDPVPLRPPAVPLVTSDPYLSIWSEADHLTDKTTVHWTHHPNPLVSLIRVDGVSYRLMGDDPDSVPAMPQTGLETTPTRTIYHFANTQVKVTLTFMTAALPNDLNVLTRPLSYITWDVSSADGANHQVSLYDSAGGQIAVNEPTQPVTWSRETMGPLTAMKIGTAAQTFFSPAGDDTRIDWGYLYLVAPSDQATSAMGADADLLAQFQAFGGLPTQDDMQMPRAANDNDPTLAVAFNLGSVGTTPVSRHVEVGYDEIYNISWFGEKLRPYWRRDGMTPEKMFQQADADLPSLVTRCTDFDNALMADMTTVGGVKYAQVAALAYRESLAANGISVDKNGQPLMFTKEDTSNGDLATVDVIFPMDPVWVLLSPTLAKASLVGNFIYSDSAHWKFPNAPHDLGTYPVASGRDDGGEGMPVEESGNMIILADAIAHDDGNADFVKPWWKKVTQWAQYLQKYGEDPGDQLCTDDFMGHLNHNANLSVKAIVALAAYGDLCRMRGDTKTADKYQTMARGFAQHWVQVADQGDHSLLAFDKPGTWSQKYNLVWDHILGLNVFPAEVRQKEIAFYKTQLQPYGVPLDSRTKLTKTDWSYWSASMADNMADFQTLTDPIWDYVNETTTRDPIADSYVTNDIHSGGMHARPVVGGFFIRMLTDPAIWKKWASQDTEKVGNWANLPPPAQVHYLVPTEMAAPAIWRYTTAANPPPANWSAADFDDSGWKTGPGAFGTPVGWTKVRTPWTETPGDLWVRRTFVMPKGADEDLKFMVYHDEDVEVYVNGVLACTAAGFNSEFDPLDISADALALMKPGATITLAAHVHQTTGGQGFDIGLANVVQPK